VEKYVMAIITIVVFGALILVALNAWRKKIVQQEASFGAPLEALEFFGELLVQAKGFYVATTHADNHLERVAAYGLGARGFAQVMVFSEGVLIVRNGERPLAIDRKSLKAISSNQVAIDKAVERGGLISIDWLQGPTFLSTHLRIVDPLERGNVFRSINQIFNTQLSKDEAK
jgi:hypothetical protein